GRSLTHDDIKAQVWARVYAVRQRSSQVEKNSLKLEEAQALVAHDAGYPSWEALEAAQSSGAAPVPAYAIEETERRIAPRRQLRARDWDEVIAAARKQEVTTVAANGQMTDEQLARIAELEHVTALRLEGSRALTDAGLQ